MAADHGEVWPRDVAGGRPRYVIRRGMIVPAVVAGAIGYRVGVRRGWRAANDLFVSYLRARGR